VIRPGDVQRMSAGTGVRHSEQNASATERVHLLQIWILPHTVDLDPSYEQKAFTDDERRGQLRLIASEDGRDGSVTVHQDVSLFASLLDAGQDVVREMDEMRHAWIQVARGAITVNDESALQGDGVVVSGESQLTIKAEEPAEIILFDLK
jgi:redox-sensitive bicupin YhaK (pirin superfamily)